MLWTLYEWNLLVCFSFRFSWIKLKINKSNSLLVVPDCYIFLLQFFSFLYSSLSSKKDKKQDDRPVNITVLYLRIFYRKFWIFVFRVIAIAFYPIGQSQIPRELFRRFILASFALQNYQTAYEYFLSISGWQTSCFIAFTWIWQIFGWKWRHFRSRSVYIYRRFHHSIRVYCTGEPSSWSFWTQLRWNVWNF